MSKPKIFVQIASYRDPELQATIQELMDRASDHKRIFVGVCLQLHKEKDKDFFDKKRWGNRVRVAHYSYTASKGVGWARAEAAKLRKNEEYTFVIDSHMRFVDDWDEKLLKALKETGSKKSFLTTYPADYDIPDTRNEGWIFKIAPTHFDDKGVLYSCGKARQTPEEHEKPTRGMLASLRCLFAPSAMFDDVPIDPNIFFVDDEMVYSVRAFTHGWDAYHPSETICYHNWDRGYRRTIFDDQSKWYEWSQESNAYVRQLLGMEKTPPKSLAKKSKYKFGKVRGQEVFELRSGINFKDRTISPLAKDAVFDFDTPIPQLRKKAKQAKQDHASRPEARDTKNKVRMLSIDYFDKGEFLDRKLKFKPTPVEGLPHGILAIENYLDPVICKRFIEYFDRVKGTRLQVVDHEKSTKSKIVSKDDPQRVTEFVPCNPIMPEITALFIDIYANTLTPFFGVDYEWFERPQVLRYHPGGKYNRHADSDHWVSDDEWVKVQDRDSSVLLYLNDDYEGGAISFPNFDFKLQPKAGMLVAFPSDHRYLHEAEPVTSGIRYAIVSWASHYGVKKLMDSAPYSSIFLTCP